MVMRLHLLILICFLVLLPGLRALAQDQAVGLAKALLGDDSFQFITAEEAHFRFHYQRGSFASSHLASLQSDAKKARLKGLEILQEADFPDAIDIFYLQSRAEMQRAIGFSVKGFSDWRSRTVLIVVNEEIRAYHAHEIMHVLSSNLWGFPADSNHCFIEGLAVFADSPCLGYSLHEIAAYMEHQRLLIPMETLFPRFRQQGDVPSYMQAGSLVEYLIDSYGAEKFNRLWQEGIQQCDHILGISIERLEADFKNYLKAKHPSLPAVNWELLLSRGCG